MISRRSPSYIRDNSIDRYQYVRRRHSFPSLRPIQALSVLFLATETLGDFTATERAVRTHTDT